MYHHPRPYDTLEEVIGTRGSTGHGSLREWGVDYAELALTEDGSIDWDGLGMAVTPRARAIITCASFACIVTGTKVALIQRSCGYALRPTLTIDDIHRAVSIIKAQHGGSCLVLVDNCYGEFTECLEPPAVCTYGITQRTTMMHMTSPSHLHTTPASASGGC